MPAIKKVVILILILVFGVLGMYGLTSMKSGSQKRGRTPKAKIVESIIITTGTVPTSIHALGRVSSTEPIDLYSEVAGTLMKGDVPFRPAQSFVRGDTLLKIDDRQAILNLNSTKSDLLNALATFLPEIKIDFSDDFKLWQDYFSRCRFNTNLPDLPETDNNKIKLYLSRFNIYKLYFSIRNQEIDLEKHYFIAPFDGSIVETQLRVGSTARRGTLLGKIISLEQLEAEVPVPAEEIEWIDPNQRVNLSSRDLSTTYTGHVARIGAQIDTRTQTVPLYVALDVTEKMKLLNGLYLQADIPGHDIIEATVIPRRALYNDRYVYIVTGGELQQREVSVVRRQASSLIVKNGLNDGDTLVIEPLQGVSSGMSATPRFDLNQSESF